MLTNDYASKPFFSASLLSLPIIFLPFYRYEVGTLFLMLIGITLLYKNKASPNAALKAWTILFLCMWFPMIASLPDAISFKNSGITTLGHLRFYLSGVAIIYLTQNPKTLEILFGILAAALLYLLLDNFIQLSSGSSIFGIPLRAGRINAPWPYEGNKMGLFVSFVAPVVVAYFLNARRYLIGITLLSIALFLVIMSGTRGAWLSALTSLFIAILFWIWVKGKSTIKPLIGIFLLISLSATLLYQNSSAVKNRALKTFQASDGTLQGLQKASGRLNGWLEAISIVSENPINGIGARGFRYTDGPFAKKHGHTHSTTLEILAGTGLIGALGYLLFYLNIFKTFKAHFGQSRILITGALCSLIAITSPLSMSLAFYSSNKATVIWWIAAVFIGLAFYRDRNASPS